MFSIQEKENGVHMEIGQNVLKIAECINIGNASIQTKHLEAKIVLDVTVEVNFVQQINVKVSDIVLLRIYQENVQ